MPKDFTIDDLLRELRRWQQQAKTGGLTFHFCQGTVQKMERKEIVRKIQADK